MVRELMRRSKMSTGLPVTVTTARVGQDFISRYVLDIDIHKNQPNIHSEEKLPNPDKWHGAELSVTIEGAWSSYRSRILKYLRQLAVITPYAAFHFQCAQTLAHPAATPTSSAGYWSPFVASVATRIASPADMGAHACRGRD
jgi:DNA topoisomerase VI subunit B